MTAPPPYGAQPGHPGPPPGYPAPRPTNTLAIVALVGAFVFAPVGIVCGHLSLSQIKRTGEDGRGLALAGLIIGYAVTVLTVIVLVLAAIFVFVLADRLDEPVPRPRPDRSTVTAAPPSPQSGLSPRGGLPSFDPPRDLGADCRYTASAEPASKPVEQPRAGRVPTDPATVSASVETDRGNIGLVLDNAKAPCTVNSFASLAQQGFFDGSTCHRLTTAPSLGVLQCGDPTGTGTGGPGYEFADEYPTNQYGPSDSGLQRPVTYPRGTLAMANAGPATNGSQFFLVYRDSELPPAYTVFGSIDETGLATLDAVAAGGVADGGDDGPPALAVTITQARLD